MKSRQEWRATAKVARALALGVAALAALAGGAEAQGPRGPNFDLDRHMETLTEELSLTEAQVVSLRPIFADQFAAHQAVMAAMRAQRGQGNREQMGQLREQMTELRQESDTKVAEILTEEQLVKYRAWQESEGGMRGRCAMGGNCGMRGQQGRRGPPPSR